MEIRSLLKTLKEDKQMEFSFNGSLNELKEWASLIANGSVCVPDTGEHITEAPETKPVVVAPAKVSAPELEMPKEEEPVMIDEVESLKSTDPVIDPTTGEYYTAFADMAKALDKLMDAGQDSDVIALLKINSANGEYGGIPASKWGAVERNAKALLKKGKAKKEELKPSITLDELKQKAANFVKADKDNNKPKLKGLLDKFEIANITLLQEKDYEAFSQDIDQLIDQLIGGVA